MLAKIVITALAGVAVVAAYMSGQMKGSVGGSLMLGFILIAAALVAGIYDAWSMRRGPLGWLASIVVAVVAVIAGTSACGLLVGALATLLNLEGRPGPLTLGLTSVLSVSVVWLALWVMDRFQSRA